MAELVIRIVVGLALYILVHRASILDTFPKGPISS